MGKSTAAYIIYDKKLLLLLMDNIPTIKDTNKLNTPGGGCEDDESYEGCILRELFEELELKLPEGRLQFLWESITPKRNTERSFLIRITDSEKNIRILHEGQEMRWFTFDELSVLNFTEHLKNIMESKNGEIKGLLS